MMLTPLIQKRIKKQVTAIPNMMSFEGAYIKAKVKEEDMKSTMRKTRKQKDCY